MALNWRQIGRRVWFVNGVLLLVMLVLSTAGLGVLFLSEALGGDAGAAVAVGPLDRRGDDGPRPRAVRYDSPKAIRGSSHRLIEVYHGSAEQSVGAGLSGSAAYATSGDDDGALVNVVFLAPDGSARLLLDRPALVTELNYPGDVYSRDSAQRFISYEIVLEDTDGDGRLTSEDARGLYVTDLTGGALRLVLSESMRLHGYSASADGRELIVTALDSTGTRRGSGEEEWPQRAYRFDLTTGELRPFVELDGLVADAARILAR